MKLLTILKWLFTIIGAVVILVAWVYSIIRNTILTIVGTVGVAFVGFIIWQVNKEET